MDQEAWMERLDAHMERGNRIMERSNRIMERSDMTMKRSNMTMKRSSEIMLRNEIAFRELRDFLREQTVAMRDLSAQIRSEGRAQRAALYQVLDRLSGNGGGAEGA